MANQRRQRQIEAHPDKGVRVTDAEAVDDDPLPSAEKILALHAIDANILTWVKERTEKEQDFRHEVIRRRTAIAEQAQISRGKDVAKKGFAKIVGLLTGAAILIGCSAGAFVLILKGHNMGWVLVGPPVALVLGAIISGKVTTEK